MPLPQDRKVILRVEHVVKRFGAQVAVNDVTLDILSGEFFSMLGPSGCGKTTLLRMIAGFERPDGGRILLDGEDIAPLPPHRRPVNTVFQHYALFPHMSVFENVAFGLRRQKTAEPEIRRRVEEALNSVRLEGYGGRQPNQLSGGQKQRVALARALVLRPRVLLLDEPLGALDHQLRLQMQVELKNIQRSCGITFLFVTHDQPEALTMSDRVAVMNLGQLEQAGASREVYERPRTEFVARFMGSSNLLPGRVTAVSAGRITADLEQGPTLTLPEGESGLREGDPLSVMIRPEWLVPRRGPVGAPGWAEWPVRVEERIYQGAVTRWIVRGLGPGALEVAGTPLVAASEGPAVEDLEPGQQGVVCWPLDRAVVLRRSAA